MASSDVVVSDVVAGEAAETTLPKPKTTSKGPRSAGKPRSKIACRHCRRRKVRCDVYPHGSPCTNCHLDNIECTLIARKRSNTSRKSQRQDATPHTHRTASSPSQDGLGGSPDSSREAIQVVRDRYHPDVRLLSNRQLSMGTPDKSTLEDDLDWLRRVRSSSERSPSQGHAAAAAAAIGPKARPLKDAPSFIHCDLSHISNEDISHLQGKGCFTFPKQDVLDDLIRVYFDYVHTHVPFLDEQEFWETYLSRHSDSPHFHHTDGYRISLVLFQAVVFAATTCASLSVLRRAGYSSRRVARRDAFSKVRALYSLDVEQDKMVLLQTLLLMSFWRGGVSDDGEDAWHWSGQAISIASDLGLHRQPSAQLTERQKTLRKRCWWSCVLRDRLLALSEQRAPRIELDKYDVPLLTLADYNVGLRSAISELSPGEELGKRTALSMFSLHLIRLVLCVGREHPSSGSRDPSGLSPPSMEVWDRTRLAAHDGSMTGLADLDFWRLNLPEVLQRPPDSAGDDTVLSCIIVHRSALQIYYHKLILSICVPRLLDAASQRELDNDTQLVHRSSVMLAKLYNELVDCDSIHCLPSECFGTSTSLEQANLQIAQSLESPENNETNVARVYTSIMAGAGIVHSPGIGRAISRPPASEPSAGPEPQPSHVLDSADVMNIDGCHDAFGLAQGGPLGEINIDDPSMDFVSDTLWTLDDARGYGDMDSCFPDLVADDGPSTSTSEANAPTPSTLLSFEALFSIGSGEFAKD